MKLRNRKNILTLSFFFLILTSILWMLLRPVNIIAVHKHDNHNYILVKNFPFIEKEKVTWWLKNKDLLRDKYNVPSVDSDGSFVIVFWDIGEGYKETDGYDSFCFKDMKPPKNCIDKNSLLIVRNSKNSGLYFVLDDGYYGINSKGKIIKLESD